LGAARKIRRQIKRLVADTGPILHLHEAGALHLFQFIGETLLAPLVLAELRVHAPTLWPGQLPAGPTPKSCRPSPSNAPSNGSTPDCCKVVKHKLSPLRWKQNLIGFSPTTRARG